MTMTLTRKRTTDTQRRCRVCQIWFEPAPETRGRECSPECYAYLVAMLQPNDERTDRDH